MPASAAAAATSAKSSSNRSLELVRYINLKLAALGQPTSRSTADPAFLEIAGPLLRNYHQKDQLLGNRLCPADTRIQSFLDSYLLDVCPNGAARLPVDSFVLDREGMARIMSLPASADVFTSPCLEVVSRRARRAAQSEERQAHHAGPVSHRRGRPAGSGRQDRGSEAGFRGTVGRGAQSAGQHDGAAVYRRSGRARALLRVAVAASAGVSGDRARSRKDHGDPLHRAGQPGQQSGFRRKHFRQRGRSVSSRKRRRARCAALDRPHGLRGPRAALGRDEEERPRAAALERGHRAPAPRSACAGRPKTSSTTAARRSRSRAAISAA